MHRRAVILLAILVFLAELLAAQEVTGALQGRVLLPDSTPAANVRLTLTGPNMQGFRTTETDARGFFELRAVPPGVYELRVALIGHRPLVIQQLAVELGRTTGLRPVTLTAQAVELAELVVEASPMMLDPVHTTAGGTLDATDYATLPVARDYKSIIDILPHANASTRGDPVNVGGSTGLENQYYIDGVNVTDPQIANRGTSLPYNFVRTVDVKTGGYEAQYGRALGAVVNAITYSGTNDHEANLFAFVQPEALSLDPRVAPTITESGAVSYDVGARVSGPILRDRLWYSTAVNPRVDRVDKEITGQGSFPDKTTAWLFAGKLTWRASAVTGLELSVFGDPTKRDGVAGMPGGVNTILSADALRFKRETGGVIGSLRATLTPSPTVLVETSVARQWDRNTDGGATAAGRAEEQYTDYVSGSLDGGYGTTLTEDRGRTSLLLRGTFTLGRHTVVAGGEYEDATTESSFETTGNGFLGRLDASSYITMYQQAAGSFHNRSPAAYLQDSWRLTERFTINAGLRWSGQWLTGASGNVVQRIPDEWQPRAGFSWQLGAVGSQRVFGSYGRFYQTLPVEIAVLLFTDWTILESYYSTDPRQPGAVPDSVLDKSTSEANYAQQIPGLQAENFDEFTLGYERLLGAGTRLTLRGMHRHLRSAFLAGYDPFGDPVFPLGMPGAGDLAYLPPARRDYTALELAADGAWRGLRYRASYVLSRTWGNYSGLYTSDLAGAVPPTPNQNFTFGTPWQAANSSGLLPNDRTHVVKLSTAYTTGFGLVGGAFLTWGSGSPINEFAVGPAPYFPLLAFNAPRGTSGRTPALWDLSLRLGYDLPLRRGLQSRVQFDLLHVGNPRETTRVDELRYTMHDANGNPSGPNPQYKQPVAYQAPMAARVGFELSF